MRAAPAIEGAFVRRLGLSALASWAYPNAHPKQTGMASKIAPTRRTVVPSLVPIAGFRDDLFVRSDPETKNVDAIQAFELVVGAESAKQAVYKLLSGLDGKGPSEGPLSETAIDLSSSKFQT